MNLEKMCLLNVCEKRSLPSSGTHTACYFLQMTKEKKILRKIGVILYNRANETIHLTLLRDNFFSRYLNGLNSKQQVLRIKTNNY